MTAVLEIDGKKMYPIKDAVTFVSYSRDYLTRLAREQKIRATLVGRSWYVDLDSLKSYEESAAIEQEIRKRKLSEERIRERDLRIEKDRHENFANRKIKAAHRHAVSAALLILVTGVLGGAVVFQTLNSIGGMMAQSIGSQSASVETAFREINQAQVLISTANGQEDVSINSYSVETKKLSPFGNGILILPQNKIEFSSSTVAEVFSDVTLVRETDSGFLEAVRVGSDGEIKGDPLPLVIVPVNEQEM